MTLHPEAVAALARAGEVGGRPFEDGTPEEARRAYDASMPHLQGDCDLGVTTEDRVFLGPAGPLRIRVLRGERAPTRDAPAVVYCHGGGWVIGNLDSHDDICRSLAQAADAVVVCPDYRLAPEHKFPAAIEDCCAALRHVHEHAGAFGIDATRIAVAGDSAGGNLATVLGLMGRDGRIPLPAAQLLFYPNTDARQTSESYRRFAEGYGLTAVTMAWFRDHYVRDRSDVTDWRVSPLLAASLQGVPPAFVALAECDILLDEGDAYAARLAAAGVPTVVRRWRGQIHGFISMGRYVTAARTAVADAVAAWRRFESRGTVRQRLKI